MLKREDVQEYTAKKQELQMVVELLFEEAMKEIDPAELFTDPAGYLKEFFIEEAAAIVKEIAPDAYAAGRKLAQKAADKEVPCD